MVKIVFLGSGGGGNLKFIHTYFKTKNIEVVGVITDRKCGALTFGVEKGIFSKEFSFNKSEKSDNEIIQEITRLNPDIVITNIHKILSESFVKSFSDKLINLHYSYLPAFKGVIGMTPVDMAIKSNNSFVGTTCHYVNVEVDSGKTICQGFFNRRGVDNVYQSTFECGALTLLNGIYVHLDNASLVEIKINDYLISPSVEGIDEELCTKIFKQLKDDTI
mgnify:CR=1 FL=1